MDIDFIPARDDSQDRPTFANKIVHFDNGAKEHTQMALESKTRVNHKYIYYEKVLHSV